MDSAKEEKEGKEREREEIFSRTKEEEGFFAGLVVFCVFSISPSPLLLARWLAKNGCGIRQRISIKLIMILVICPS